MESRIIIWASNSFTVIQGHSYLLDGVEHGQPEVLRAALARPDAAHHVGAVLDGLLGVECSLLAGEALADDFGVLGEGHVGSGLGVTCPHPTQPGACLTSRG